MRRLYALILEFRDATLFDIAILPLMLLATPLLGFYLFSCTRAKRGRIRITRVDDNLDFTSMTREALALVETFDPRRAVLLQKELRFIDDTPSTEFAEYDPVFRRCKINFGAFEFDWHNKNAPDYSAHREWYIARYAAAIIHEATHGRLYGMGFPYTKRTQLRVERICTRESRNFAANLPQTTYHFAHDLVPPFDASRWDYSWNTPRWQQMKDQFRRAMKQMEKEDN